MSHNDKTTQATPCVSSPRPGETLEEALDRARGPRVMPAVVAVDGTPRAQHFASTVAPRSAGKPSVLDSRYRARPALEPEPVPALEPDGLGEMEPARRAALEERARRSVLTPGTMLARPATASMATPVSVPVGGLDPTPIRMTTAAPPRRGVPIYH